MEKNRNKGEVGFANINFIGCCNAHCFFCIGNEAMDKHNQYFNSYYDQFPNLKEFLSEAKRAGIKKLYLTGLDAEPTMYPYLEDFVAYLRGWGFTVGLRTNGIKKVDYSMFNGSVSVSVHSANKWINRLIGIPAVNIPELTKALSGHRHRYAIVINRYNLLDWRDTLDWLCSDSEAEYIQLRQICTDDRDSDYALDHEAFDQVAAYMKNNFEQVGEILGNPIYEYHSEWGVKKVAVWRPMSNDANSWNYFIDGKFLKSYFVVEGYNKKEN